MPFSSLFLRNWPQFAKILLLTILVLTFSFGWVWFRELPKLQEDLIRERVHATQYPIQMAVSILELYRSRAMSGELSLPEAKERALRTLQNSRYANNQYFWVHDTALNMLMHPFSTELVGHSVADYRDSHGVYLFSEMNKRLQRSSSGVIEYTWPRPGTDVAEQKMSCFRLYEPWGWVIGSGIYLDDVNADISAIKRRIATSVFSAFMFAIAFSLYVIYRINQPLSQTIAFARQIAKGEPIESIEVRPETEGGKVVAVIKKLMSDLQSAHMRHEAMETEQRHLEGKLVQAQKMEAIGKLAGGVAHEFNNILQVVAGYVMLLKEETDNPEHRGYLETVDGAITRASQLTQGMLAYSRQQVFRMFDCDPDETIRHIEPFLKSAVGENIRLELIRSQTPIHCCLDPVQIQQAVINLVSNARDAINGQGTIRITTGQQVTDHAFALRHATARPGNFAVISVSDTGTGIDAALGDKIFEPFFTTKDIGKGTGLGLSIVYGIVSQHNGFITFDSAPDEGTTFSIFLPLAVAAGESESGALPVVCREYSDNCGTILFAEDDEDVREVVRQLLEKNGYTVLCAADGAEAVAVYMAFRTSIDLLLFDVMMPVKSGVEALAEIRRVNMAVPACFISGYACEELAADQNVDGINAFISKPVDNALLLNTIGRQIKNSQTL